MNRLVASFVLDDIRRSPGRAAAVTALLVAALLVPTVVGGPAFVGAVTAVVVSFTAVVGAARLTERRTLLLHRNGAPAGLHAKIMAASIAVTGLAAVVLVASWTALTGFGPTGFAAVTIGLLLPVLTAPVAVRLVLRSTGPGTPPVAGWSRGWRIGTGVAAVLVGLVVSPLLVALAAVYAASTSWSSVRFRRVVGFVVVVIAGVGAVFGIGASRTWNDLTLTLPLLLPVLFVVVAAIGVTVQRAMVVASGLLGPRLRLAVAPFTVRRRVLAPMVALVTLVTTAAVTQGVVGAGFGERERLHQEAARAAAVAAGSTSSQVIATVPPVDAARLRALVADTVAGSGAAAVVVEQVGSGLPVFANRENALALLAGGSSADYPASFATAAWMNLPDATSARVTLEGSGSSWIGIVRPDDLALLGWQAAAAPLARGELVLVARGPAGTYPGVEIVAGSHHLTRAGIVVDGVDGGADLPGALVSAPTATRLDPLSTVARVVLVPSPTAERPATGAQMIGLGRRIVVGARALPLATTPEGTGSTDRDTALLVAAVGATAMSPDEAVRRGSDPVVDAGGPLNAVPFLAGTRDVGRASLVGMVLLSLLITLSVVFLALATTRRDDRILESQGAPRGLVSFVVAVQAGVVTVSASLVAAVLGIGVPAACFALYNRSAELPPIPLVVPPLVPVVLVVVPVVAMALASLVPLGRRGGGVADLATSSG